ncbi:hypothetical protein P154DRAFT_438573 [Amniculicola lignicola CBS 123094]|uniref:Uncharacterized protein n=1 Tax=Amniculicola lignicola CBS 123094 TaxID=1392246 RepID=A0A6A5WF71_9PLEO|nr:hypothetical protein P154DRAFT_438573 [Amniculicola lignicola CBS 123094]
MDLHCHKSECEWIHSFNISGISNAPPLLPNPELSGIGVILGFSITAYLTLALLIFHYITVYNPDRSNRRGKRYINAVDRDVLALVRRYIAWTPSRRFEYAMEKSILILSDAQLVTGLAILISGYSQLKCGISAYHWAIMVYVAWFSSFTFLSAMTFLEGYFQTNNTLRIIRIFFMFVLASLMIVALLPTGSHNWLDLADEGGGFYPALPTACYFKQLRLGTFSHGGPKIWSMVVSILVVGVSYIHSGIRLFDPTAEFSRRYFRAWPGKHIKRFLHHLERKSRPHGTRATLWNVSFLAVYVVFVIARASYDICESMLTEILWLSFAIAWGTIKLYDTRNSAALDPSVGEKVLEENFWSFGQTLPLVLILLPLLSMAQAYLDNDAKAAEAAHRAAQAGKDEKEKHQTSSMPAVLNEVRIDAISPSPSSLESDTPPPLPTRSPLRLSPISKPPTKVSPHLPSYYQSFSGEPWYHDQILLVYLQLLLVVAFALYLLNALSNFLGLSFFIRNRLFLTWILAMIPAGSVVHLLFWYVAACVVNRIGAEQWLKEKRQCGGGGQEGDGDGGTRKGAWRTLRWGTVVYWFLRMFLVVACVMFTFWLSFDIAGPNALVFYF